MNGTHMMLRDAMPSPGLAVLVVFGFALFVAAEVVYKRVGAATVARALSHGWHSATAFTDSLLWQRIGVIVAAICVTALLMLLAHLVPSTY